MSDALTDIGRDEDKQKALHEYFAALGYLTYQLIHLPHEKNNITVYQMKLMSLAKAIDEMPRGYFTEKSSLVTQTDATLQKLRQVFE